MTMSLGIHKLSGPGSEAALFTVVAAAAALHPYIIAIHATVRMNCRLQAQQKNQ